MRNQWIILSWVQKLRIQFYKYSYCNPLMNRSLQTHSWCVCSVWGGVSCTVDSWLSSSERRWRSDLSSDHSSSELLTATVTTLWHPSGIFTFLLFVLFCFLSNGFRLKQPSKQVVIGWSEEVHCATYTGKWASAQSQWWEWVGFALRWNYIMFT